LNCTPVLYVGTSINYINLKFTLKIETCKIIIINIISILRSLYNLKAEGLILYQNKILSFDLFLLGSEK